MSDVVKALREAREKINTPDKWTKGVYARAADGGDAENLDWDEVDENAMWRSDPVCFCALGAIGARENGPDYYSDEVFNALRLALPNPYEETATFNDAPETTHADIMALFDRAIAAAESTT
jgi:hypothetical protein